MKNITKKKEIKAVEEIKTKPKIMLSGIPISKEEEKENQRKDKKKSNEQSIAYDLMQLKNITKAGAVGLLDGCMTFIAVVVSTTIFIIFSPLFMFRKEDE